MSKKVSLFTSVWTAIVCAVIYGLYGLLPAGGNVSFTMGWAMFIMLICFFGMRLKPANSLSMVLSSLIGCIWGQVYIILIFLIVPFVGITAAGILSVGIGTALVLIVQGGVLSKTPFGLIPFNFAGIALTFSQFQGHLGDNAIALVVTILLGIGMAVLCGLGNNVAKKIFVIKEDAINPIDHA